MNYIYCYMNKINQHKYVGQTNNFNRRIREHRSCSFNPNAPSYNDLIHKKIREYGEENFDITILETIYIEDAKYVDERERYWIEKLQSFRGTGLGYNSDFGGGKKNSSLFAIEEILQIKQEIKNGVTFLDLQKKYSISASFLSSINHGIYFFDPDEKYPLFQYYKSNEDYEELIDLLLNSPLTLADIARRLNIGYSTVKKINAGTLRKGLYPTYPIRTKSANEIRSEKIKDLLLNTTYSQTEIAEITGASVETVRRNNVGLSFKNNNLSYPLRSL